ncbi:glycosyltransferase family 4 protein [Cellulomonas timonensis]|uniref:glycosyltransferase family 4 protein n=1 Tax=Cellulomonas timonensis TaxID=1689271 RepID=UPI00082DC4A3|nr:glycosyltransferase family 1 protein [Cellulomonas timonensis]
MRVLVDATAIPSDRGGVGRYVDELLRALDVRDVELVVVCQVRDVDLMEAAVPGARVIAAPRMLERRAARLVWEQTGLPVLARRIRADVVHSPHYTSPVLSPGARVVTLHDATFFSDRDVHSSFKTLFFRSATWLAVRRADALVVPSRATRDEVVRYAGGRAEQFYVAHHGVDPEVFHPVAAAEQERVARSLGLEGRPYVAFLGTLEPRKNVPALIEAWVEAVAGLADPPALVVAGGAGWDDAVQPAIEAVPAGLQVIRPGYLPLDDLAGFLGGAQVVAYPSLGEGFGLPVLEAMACGAAVLTSRRLSLPEVGGDAVEYTETDAASIATALAQLLASKDRREELARAAVERAALFTWGAAADVHVEAYRAAVQRAGGSS